MYNETEDTNKRMIYIKNSNSVWNILLKTYFSYNVCASEKMNHDDVTMEGSSTKSLCGYVLVLD